MNKKTYLNQLEKVNQIANYSKVGRLIHNPFKYIYAIFFREFIYPQKKKEKILSTHLFYGKPMKIALPASTDIYLTGGKSHSSEIRLAQFLIQTLTPGAHFLDIGAHYGYFTLLAAELVGTQGKVIAFEPAGKSYQLLLENTQPLEQVSIYRKAVSSSTEKITFYEFANLQSEYNTTDIQQFEHEAWFQQAPPQKVEVEAITLEQIIAENVLQPLVIKIDVEGAELQVLESGKNYLAHAHPQIVMEYLAPKRNNENHRKATQFLQALGYNTYILTEKGTLAGMEDIDNYLVTKHLESDNIVFKKD